MHKIASIQNTEDQIKKIKGWFSFKQNINNNST